MPCQSGISPTRSPPRQHQHQHATFESRLCLYQADGQCAIPDCQHLLLRADRRRQDERQLPLGTILRGPDELLAGSMEFYLLSGNPLSFTVKEPSVFYEIGQALNSLAV